MTKSLKPLELIKSMKGLSKEKFFFFDVSCSELEIAPNSIEHAYLAILNSDLKSAGIIFKNNDSPRAKWGTVFVSILQGYMQNIPTFFEVRNFLEIDLDFLLKNNLIDYVEQCLGAIDILATINQETYKFTARVMLVNKLYSAALKYMEKSKKVYYNDPELHFMYAKYYLEKQNYDAAYFYINECLRLLPSYYPAIIMKQRIEELSF